MNPVAYRCILVLTLAAGATSIPAWADAVNGQKLFEGLPSARFPAGSHPCADCHGLSPGGDPIFTAAGRPDLIDAAINTTIASFRAMKPIYGAGGISVLSAADEQDLADFLESVVSPGGGGTQPPTFAVTPTSANFGSQSVGIRFGSG